MKKMCALLLCLALLLGLGGCGGPKKYTAETFAFDTIIGLTAYSKDEAQFQQLKSTVFGRMNELHRKYDIFNEYEGLTNLCTVNRMAGQAVPVDGDIGRLLELAFEAYAATNGLVDISKGRLYALWREAQDTGLLPAEEAVQAALAQGSMEDVRWDGQTITLLRADTALDVGALAKGLAAQMAAEAAEQAGFTDFVLSAGGNIVARGQAEGKRPWSVGIRDPRSADAAAHVTALEICDQAVVTSGGYERKLVVEGKSYCHIIDPRTGRPADKVLSATAVCDDSGLADCYSTALFLMEADQGLAFAQRNGFRAVIVDEDGTLLDTEQP